MREPSGREAIVFSLYDAALDPKQWGPVATQLAHVLRAGSAAIQVRTGDQVQVLSRSANFSDGDEAVYRSYYHAHDVLVPRAAARGMNRILSNTDLIDEREWTETEIYKDYFSALGIHHLVGGLVSLPHNAIGVFSVHRDRHGKPFSAADKADLAHLMPHMRNAIRIQQSLGTSSLEQHATKTFLEQSTTALLVVDRVGRLLLASAKGEDLLARSQALTVIAGRIVASRATAHHRLLTLIESAVDTAAGRSEAAGGTLALPAEHQSPLSVMVSPLRPQRDGIGLAEPAALILVRDPSERVDITNLAFELFGLTRSEALLANGLANGLTIHEVALAHGVTLNTIRTQLKSVLTKTSTSRQTELVSLLFRSRAGHI